MLEMNIAMICSHFYPYIGGVENHVMNLSKGLEKKGCTIDIFTSRYDLNLKSEEILSKNITVYRSFQLCTPLNNPILPFLLLDLYSKKKYDILHTHDHYFFGSNVAAIYKFFKETPFVLTHHTFPITYDGLSNIIQKIYDTTLTRYTFKKVNKIIALTNLAKNYIRSYVDDDKIYVIPNGVDCTRYHPKINSENFKIRYNIDKSEINLLFVGRMIPRKGLQFLIKALYILNQHFPIKLIAVGSGPHLTILKKLIEYYNLEDKVLFTGKINEEMLMQAYSLCDILVIPSLLGEVLPITLLEGMAMGKPIVASRVGGITEVLKFGKLGLSVHPGDVEELIKAITLLIENSEIAKNFGTNARKAVEDKYNWTDIARQTLKCYTSSLGY